MTELRIGVLGASRIAEQAIVKPAQILGHRLVAVAARDRGRAETFAQTHGVERVVDSYAELIADPEVDVIYNPLAHDVRMFELLEDGTLGTLQRVEVVMRMPEPKPDDPRWNLELAGGSVMDLGCYGLHVHRQLGRFAGGEPTVVAARAVERTRGVDEACDIELDDLGSVRDDPAPRRGPR